MKKTPKLRFPEFSGEWEEKKLGEISDVRDGTHDSPKYIEKGFPLITSKNLSGNGKLEFNNINFISEEDYININKRSNVEIGDILFGMIGTIGNPVIVEKEDFAIKNVALIKQKKGLLNKFLIHYLNSERILKQFHVLNAGGTQKFIALGIIRDLELSVPIIQEQHKIASFFSLIDNKIEKQQEKVKALEEYKKGIMQKIFSQEIRFKDGNEKEYGHWEEKLLGEYLVEYKEKTIVNNQYPVLTSSRSGLILQTDYFSDRQVTTEENIGYNIIPYGYVTFRSRSDDGTFRFNQNNIIEKGIVSYFYPVFTFNEKIDSYYALIYMNNYLKQQILREIVGTSQLVLSLNKLKQLKIKFPLLEEQQKIGKVIYTIDKKYEKEKCKLDQLKEWRKGLLQQMFV